MAKSSGLGARFFVDQYNLTGDITSLDRCSGGPALLDCTAIGSSGFERIGGVRTGGMEVTSWFNDAAVAPVGEHTVLRARPTTDRQATYCHRATLGAPAACCISKQINYDGTRDQAGALTFKTTVESNTYGLEWGHLLTAGAVTSTAAENLTGYDDGAGASTNFGLQLYVHLLAFTGTSVTVTIQDSDDDGTDPYATVTGATSGALSAVGVVRVATGTTENVKEWMRVALTGTYSSAQLVVVVVRNIATPVF